MAPPDRTEWRKWYRDKAWYRLRHNQLAIEKTCRFCRKSGLFVAAEVVDHIRPHRGDRALFFDAGNLQSLCAPCHNSVKQAIERRGYSSDIGPDGYPVDRDHPFNR